MQSIIDVIGDFAHRFRLFERGPFTVGLSGGPDSVALALAMTDLKVPFSAVHFNHGLRGADSDADEQWVRDFCGACAIPLTVVQLEVPENRQPGESVEMAARRLRLERWHGIGSTVCLGHHLNDALETFLLRLCRGANASSLTGLRPIAIVSGIAIVRPLLCVSRQAIIDFVADKGVTPRHDASNDEVDIQRNMIRHQVVPILESLAGGTSSLFKTLQNTADDASYLDELAEQYDGDVSAADLRNRPWPIAYRVLRNWLYAHPTSPPIRLTGTCADRLRAALDSPHSVLIDVDDAWFLRFGGDSHLTVVSKEDPPKTDPIVWNWTETPELTVSDRWTFSAVADANLASPSIAHESFAAADLPRTLIIRSRCPGDSMVPFGARSTKPLGKLISDAKLDPEARKHIIVITTVDNQIIWVPGVRRAEFGRLSSDDTARVCLMLRKHGG